MRSSSPIRPAHRTFAGLPSVIANDPDQLTFVAFDILHVDGTDLRAQTLVERRERLAKLIGRGGSRIQFSQTLPGTGPQVFTGDRERRA